MARTKPGAMITETYDAIEQVIMMIKEKKVRTVNGNIIDIKADSVCVHGDGAKALEFIVKIREVFEKEDIKVCPMCEI